MSHLLLDDGRRVYPFEDKPYVSLDKGTGLVSQLMSAFAEAYRKDVQVNLTLRQGRLDETAFSVREVHSRDVDLPAGFAVIPLENARLGFGVIAENESQAVEGHRIWGGLLNIALERVEAMLSFDWRAVVAPVREYSPPVALDGEYSLGDLHLAPNSRPYARLGKSSPRGLHQGGRIEMLHPVMVTGSSSAHDWNTARVAADDQAMRLCTALTVDTGEYWEVLESAQLQEAVGPIPAAEAEWLDGEIDQNWGPPTQLYLTTVAEEAYRRINEDDDYRALCSALYNACTVEHTSPSLAHVAYVGILETLGGQWVELKTCPECNAKTGSGKRFRRALKEALPALSNRDRKPLEQQYDRRSKTAHEGRLFAGEDRLSRVMDFFQSDSTDAFRHQGVPHIKGAALELLRDIAVPRSEMEEPQEAGKPSDYPV